MYNDYTLMAGGHQPRPSQKERVRQRFMHKLRYFVERYGTYQCSGCGRCLQHCPVGIDIVEAIENVQQAAAGKGE
jgi:Fe-S oxidoreductase